MTRRKKDYANETPLDAEEVDKLFDGDNPGAHLGCCDIDMGTLARLADAVCGLGGVVSIWRDRTSGALVISARVGEKRRSWEFDTAEEAAATLPILANRFASAYAKTLK